MGLSSCIGVLRGVVPEGAGAGAKSKGRKEGGGGSRRQAGSNIFRLIVAELVACQQIGASHTPTKPCDDPVKSATTDHACRCRT